MKKLFFAAVMAGIVLFAAGCGDDDPVDTTGNTIDTTGTPSGAAGNWLLTNKKTYYAPYSAYVENGTVGKVQYDSTYTYDANGRLLSTVFTRQYRTEYDSIKYTYDGNGRISSEVHFGKQSGGKVISSEEWKYTYGSKGISSIVINTKRSNVDVDQITERKYTYGANTLSIVSTVRRLSSGVSYITDYVKRILTYDGSGRILSEVGGATDSTGRFNAICTEKIYTYDGKGRKTSELENMRNYYNNADGEITPIHKIEWTYDEKGRISSENIIALSGSGGGLSSYTYDHADPIIRAKVPTLPLISYSHHSNPTSEVLSNSETELVIRIKAFLVEEYLSEQYTYRRFD